MTKRSNIIATLLILCLGWLHGADGSAREADDELLIPADSRDVITFGPLGCPIMLVNADAWHLKQRRLIRSLDLKFNANTLRALSSNGRYFAMADKSPNQKGTEVLVWDVVQRKEVGRIEADPEKFVDVLAFAGASTLVVGGRHGNELTLWNAEMAQPPRTLKLPARQISDNLFAVSADGQHVTTRGDDAIMVCSLANGQRVGALSVMASNSMPPGRVLPNSPRNQGSRVDTQFALAWTRGVSFSPDGREVAAVCSFPYPRLMCWTIQGKLLFEGPLAAIKLGAGDVQVRWLPDGSGWFVNGNLVDRSLGLPVLCWAVRFDHRFVAQPLDRDRVLCRLGGDTNLSVLRVPWEQIEASHAAMKQGVPAYLAPNQPVSVRVEVINARGNVQETQQTLRDAVATRMQRIGIPVQDGAATTLVLRLAEREGDQLPIVERQSPFDFRGKDTGRVATEAKGDLVVELLAAGEQQPVWRDILRGFSSRTFNEEINDQSVRKSMLENLTRSLSDLPLPYFYPKQKDLFLLPVVVH